MLVRRLSLSIAAASAFIAAVACLAVMAAPASACYVPPGFDDCIGNNPQPSPPPPPPPHCDLDDPRYPQCSSYVREDFFFTAANPAGAQGQRHPMTVCKVSLEGATPASPWGYDRVKFRTSNDCDAPLRRVIINTRLVNATQNTVAYGNHAECHQGSHPNCGDVWMASTGDVTGLSWGSYTLEATVRLALDEGQEGDPWVTTPGAQPMDEPGACAPGGYVTRCVLTLPIELHGV